MRTTHAEQLKAAFATRPNKSDMGVPEVNECIEPEESVTTGTLELVSVFVHTRGKFGFRLLGDSSRRGTRGSSRDSVRRS